MPGPDARDASERFSAAAESILLVSGQSQPCITNVQAFLCLAYYEIGRGNLSKGWGFSGLYLGIFLARSHHFNLLIQDSLQALPFVWFKTSDSREILTTGLPQTNQS